MHKVINTKNIVPKKLCTMFLTIKNKYIANISKPVLATYLFAVLDKNENISFGFTILTFS